MVDASNPAGLGADGDGARAVTSCRGPGDRVNVEREHRMDRIRIAAVDERDSSWESEDPRFRVYFQVGGPAEERTSYATATYDVEGADIAQVIDWAQRQVGDDPRSTYAIALVYDDVTQGQVNPGCERGLVWLLGGDMNDVRAETRPVQERALARRRDPIVVSSGDRMPATPPVLPGPPWVS